MTTRITLLACALLGLSSVAGAQGTSLFSASETLDIGQIATPHLMHGDMWYSPATSMSPMQFPKGVSTQVTGYSAIWFGGRDAMSQLKLAAQLYRTKGADLWPGPVGSAASSYTSAETQAWARIWKINSATIDSFLQISTHTVANTPAAILEWPGKGNTHAKGANNTSLTITSDMAPFVDVNRNGTYEPLAGDYPGMKGSQMLWWVMNDNAAHDVSNTNAMNAEVRVSAYAYSKGTVADNIIFYEYDLLNTSAEGLSDFVFATFADLDISNPFNDNMGFDSSARLTAIFDYDNTDLSARRSAAGHVLLDQPGDAWNQYSAAGSMTYFWNQPTSDLSDPRDGIDFYRYMTGYNRAGTPMRANSKYALASLDAACATSGTGTDQRVLLATAPTSFPGRARLHYAFAFVAADSAGSCQDVDFSRLKQTADSAYKLYWNPGRVTPAPTKVPISIAGGIEVYPNPATQTLHVAAKLRPEAQFTVTNSVGATMAVPASRTMSGYELDILALPPGLYHLLISDSAIREHRTFIKR